MTVDIEIINILHPIKYVSVRIYVYCIYNGNHKTIMFVIIAKRLYYIIYIILYLYYVVAL